MKALKIIVGSMYYGRLQKNDPCPFAVRKPTGDITSFRYCEPLTETDIAGEEFQVKDWENGIPTVPKGE